MNRFIAFMAAFVSTFALFSCEDSAKEEEAVGFAIKTYSPTKVVPGTHVQITGNGLGDVKEVIFPGAAAVTEITKFGDGLINVVVPAGVKAGQLSVVANDGSKAEAAVPLTVGATSAKTISPSDEAWVNDEMTISGVDMEFIDKVIIPGAKGDIEFTSMTFSRKSTGQISMKLPWGLKNNESGTVRVIDIAGNEKTFDIPRFVNAIRGVKGPLEGEWIWGSNAAVFGSGGYLAHTKPEWWQVGVGSSLDTNAPGEGLKASKMKFEGPFMNKYLADGTLAGEGTYKVDMTKTKTNPDSGAPWSIGELTVEGTSVLIGKALYNSAEVKPAITTFDIIELTASRVVLAYAEPGTGAWGNCLFWIFRKNIADPTVMDLAKGDDAEIAGVGEDYWIDPDWFVKKSANTFTFQANSGQYRVMPNSSLKTITVIPLIDEKPATLQADGSGTVWILGEGIGKPALANAPGWNPGKGIPLTPIGGKKYRITIVGGKQLALDKINFKFFHQDGWGGEFKSDAISTSSSIVAIGTGDSDGNIGLASGQAFEDGVTYEFVLDLSGGNSAAQLSVNTK